MNVDEQFYKYGYFSEYIPNCFNSEKLYSKISKIRTSFDKNNNSESVEIAIYKSETTRRIIKVPNPEQYVSLSELMIKNIDLIEKLIETSNNTESNPFRTYKNNTILDIPLFCEVHSIPSNFMKSFKERIRFSMGYKYMLKVDLLKFYDSIYTHTIEWAIVGKENARLKKKKGNLGEKLDNLIRSLQKKESKGIPTGPITSRIISEILLVKIDLDLKNAGYVFKRYVDDYKFYFKTEGEAIGSLKKISNIISEYRLNINENKIAINKYPYDSLGGVNNIIYQSKKINKKNQIIYIIDECNKSYSNGIEASYKYILKSLKKINSNDSKNWIYLESFFLSVLSIKPDLTRFIYSIIIQNKEKITEDFILKLKTLILSNARDLNESEVLWMLWLYMKISNEKLDEKCILELLKLDNDFIRIILLNYIFENKLNDSSKKIKLMLDRISKEISEKDINGTSWLLLYESIFNNWFPEKKLNKKIENNNFFRALLKNKINFFNEETTIK